MSGRRGQAIPTELVASESRNNAAGNRANAGHLFPGLEADAVARMREMLVGDEPAPRPSGPPARMIKLPRPQKARCVWRSS